MTELKRFFFLMRHGESEANALGLIASRIRNTLPDYPLTSAGKESVRQKALRFFEERGAKSFQIISSPFLRTRQTAEILAELIGDSFCIDERLRERDFGVYDGTSDKNYRYVWENDICGRLSDAVEPLDSVFKRVSALVKELDESGRRDNAVILCTHGDVASIALAGYQGYDLSTHRRVGGLEQAEIRLLNARSS